MAFVNQYNCLMCICHPGSFDGQDGFPYVGEKGATAGKFSIAIDRRQRPSGKPLDPVLSMFISVTLDELAEYAKNREKYPYLRIRCKPDESGTVRNGGRYIREMMIDWDCLDRLVAVV